MNGPKMAPGSLPAAWATPKASNVTAVPAMATKRIKQADKLLVKVQGEGVIGVLLLNCRQRLKIGGGPSQNAAVVPKMLAVTEAGRIGL
jgi:redox-regulated HSP33 family molecular chaperone